MMLFNPHTMRLLTKKRKLIKQLHCPQNVRWEEMGATDSKGGRNCESCNRRVQDINNMSAKEVMERIHKEPDACLKLELSYDNIRIDTQDDA